jgi:RNA polymerase sigma-70 factor (ECF subfamily)
MTDADDDERRLVEAAQRDLSKFAELYERHFEQLYAFVVWRVRDRDVAEDVTAEVFHKALANLRSYEWRGTRFAAWLRRIATNTLVDRSKRSAREVVDSDRVVDAAVEPDVARDLARIEERAQLWRLVGELPPDQRTVLVERFVEQRSIHDIAARLDKSDGAIKQLQFRALQRLRARMGGGDA